MAQRRMLGCDVSTSERLAELASDSHRMLWTWMVPHTDRDGCITGNPRTLRGVAIPLLDWTVGMVAEAVADMVRVGLVTEHVTGAGRPYLKMTNHDRHQKGMRYEREAPSTFTEEDSGDVAGVVPHDGGSTPASTSHKGMEWNGIERNGSEGAREAAPAPAPPASVPPPGPDPPPGSTDPRAEAIAAALRASPKAVVIANPDRYAEDLLGSLGAMALNVEPAELSQSVTEALADAEDGILEHKLRRLVRGYVRQTAKTPPGERSHRAVLETEPQDDTRRRIGCGACKRAGDDGELVPQGNGTRQCNTCHRVVRVARRAS